MKRQPPPFSVLKTSEADRLRFAAQVAEYLEKMGRRMRERREELHLSRDEVARRMGGKTTGNQVYRWETGKHQPSSAALERMAGVLSVKTSYFMSDGPSPSTPPADLATRLDRLEADVRDLHVEMRAMMTAALERQDDLYTRLEAMLEAATGITSEQQQAVEAIRSLGEGIARFAEQDTQRSAAPGGGAPAAKRSRAA